MIGRVWAVAGVYLAWARANPGNAGVALLGMLAVVVAGLTIENNGPLPFTPVAVFPFLVQGVLVPQQPALERLPVAPAERWAGSALPALLLALAPGVLVSVASGRRIAPDLILALVVLVAAAPLHARTGQRGAVAMFTLWIGMAMTGALTSLPGAVVWLVAMLGIRALPAPVPADAADPGGTGTPGSRGAWNAAQLAGPVGRFGWIAPAALGMLLATALLGRSLSGEDPVRDLRDLRGSVQLSWNTTRGLAPALVIVGGPVLGTALAASLGFVGATGRAPGAAAAARLPVRARALLLVGLGRAGGVWAAGILCALLGAAGIAALGVDLPTPWATKLAATAPFTLALVIAAQLSRGLAPLLPATEARISRGLTFVLLILTSFAIPGITVAAWLGGWMIVEVAATTALLSTFAWATWCVRSVG